MQPRIRQLLPRRFLTADRSMEPTLVDGQGLIGVQWGRPAVGQLRTFEHPDRPGFWLVKRVTAVSGDSMIVESDNLNVGAVDSNHFGPVNVAGSYRIVLRVPRRWM
jgi:signal peptidase I